MKTKQEVAELIRQRIAELEQTILGHKQTGDWEMVTMTEQALALRQRELEIFK